MSVTSDKILAQHTLYLPLTYENNKETILRIQCEAPTAAGLIGLMVAVVLYQQYSFVILVCIGSEKAVLKFSCVCCKNIFCMFYVESKCIHVAFMCCVATHLYVMLLLHNNFKFLFICTIKKILQQYRYTIRINTIKTHMRKRVCVSVCACARARLSCYRLLSSRSDQFRPYFECV